MEDVPRYEEAESSPLTQVLKANQFSGWYKLSSLSNCAFYKLLSIGLATHFEANFAGADYLRKQWEKHVPRVKQVWESDPTNHKFENPQFWDTIGNALIEDLRVMFGVKPWFPEVAAGKIVDKNQKDIYTSFLGYLGVALVWYEMRSNGQVRALPFISASQGFPQVYITLATEGNMLYLLFHSNFNPRQYQEGYPFFTQSPTDPKIANVDSSIRSNDSDAKDECLRKQAEVITLLAEMLYTFGPKPLPLEAAAHQTRLRELIGTVTQLAKACNCELKLRTQEMDQVLTVQTAPDVFQQAVPQYHDCSNCESFPDCGPMVDHLGEQFHAQCLASYIGQLPDPVNSVLCPRCGKELPDHLVGTVAPQVIAERGRRKKVSTMVVRASTVQPGQNPPNFMPSQVNFNGGASPGLAYNIASPGNQYAHQASSPQPAFNPMSQAPSPQPAYNQMPQTGSAYSPGQLSSPQPQYSAAMGANPSPQCCPLCQLQVLGNWFKYDCQSAACVMCALRNNVAGYCPFCSAPLSANEQHNISVAYSRTFTG